MTSVRKAGIGAPSRAIPRRRRTRIGWYVLPALLLVGLFATIGRATVLDAHGDSSPEGLVAQLVEIEEALTGVPLMPTVALTADAPWGTVRGDFVGARLSLERYFADLGRLVELAGDGSGPVVQAVDDVARAYRALHEAYVHLEAYEDATLAVIVTREDDGESSLAVEEARGHAEIGLRLALGALEWFHAGYRVLRDADAAVGSRSLFELRYADVENAVNGDANTARQLLDMKTSQVLVPVDRFSPTGGGSLASSVSYLCVDRSYTHNRGSEAAPPPVPTDESGTIAYPDCPNLESGGPLGADTED
jgi:hypothetical protein